MSSPQQDDCLRDNVNDDGGRHPLTYARLSVRALAIAGAVFTCCGMSCRHKETYIVGEQLLADNRIAFATIVVADKPDLVPSVKKFGREHHQQTVIDWALFLRQELKRATGADFPVVKASEVPDDGLLILVGTSSLSIKHGFDGIGLPPEEVRIASFERGVAIFGERLPAGGRGVFPSFESPMANPKTGELDGLMADRGTPHAVTFFLEKFVGFRYYAVLPGDIGTVVPEVARLRVPVPTDFRTAPDFPYRDGHGFTDTDWPVPGRLVSHKEGASLDLRMNHVYHLMPEDLPDRPELFAKDEDGSVPVGRRQGTPYCYASPEYFELLLEHVEHFDRHNAPAFAKWHGNRPRKGMRTLASPFAVHAGPHDANWDDWDPRSQPFIDRGRPSTATHSDLLGQFLAKLGVEVENRWPGRRVKFLAQNRYSDAPDGRIKLPPNVDVLWCMRRPASMTNLPAYKEYCDSAIDAWHEALGRDRNRLAIWEYIHRPQVWTKIPIWAPRSQQRFLRENKEKFAGMFFNFGGQTPIAFPFLAISTELLWNADLDVDTYYDEFCDLMFGSSGKTMRQLFALVIDRYENTVWTDKLGHPVIHDRVAYEIIFPPEVVAQVKDKLIQAREIAQNAGEELPLARIDYMINVGGEWGFDAFFRSAEAYHQPRHALPVSAPLIKEGDILIDGRLEEPVWQATRPARLFEGEDPETLRPVRRWWETDVRIVATSSALYVACEAMGELPPVALARQGDDESILRDDFFAVVFRGKDTDRIAMPDAQLHDLTDVEADRMIAEVNADLYVAVNASGKASIPGISAAATVADHHWILEIRIPWDVLPGATDQMPSTFFVDLRRYTAARHGPQAMPVPRRQTYATAPECWVRVDINSENH